MKKKKNKLSAVKSAIGSPDSHRDVNVKCTKKIFVNKIKPTKKKNTNTFVIWV